MLQYVVKPITSMNFGFKPLDQLRDLRM